MSFTSGIPSEAHRLLHILFLGGPALASDLEPQTARAWLLECNYAKTSSGYVFLTADGVDLAVTLDMGAHKAEGRDLAQAKLREALGPVLDWYQSDEAAARDPIEIVQEAVADLETDRTSALLLARIVLAARKADGDEAHRILPQIWPLIAEADKLPSMPPRKEIA